jgi:hypothetical protein
MQRQTLDYAEEGTHIIRQSVEEIGVPARGCHQTGTGIEVQNVCSRGRRFSSLGQHLQLLEFDAECSW